MGCFLKSASTSTFAVEYSQGQQAIKGSDSCLPGRGDCAVHKVIDVQQNCSNPFSIKEVLLRIEHFAILPVRIIDQTL